MRTIISRAIAILVVALVVTGVRGEGESSGIPKELKGFRGMMSGELIKKNDVSFDFRIGEIMRVWKENKAENPKKAIGRTVRLSLERLGRNHRSRIMVNYTGMKEGDAIELEAFDLGGSCLYIKESLRRVETKKDGQRDEGVGKEGSKKEGKEGEQEKEKPGPHVTPGSSGQSTGQVVSCGESLTIRTDNGEETFKVRKLRRRGKWMLDPATHIALTKTIKPGMNVNVSWNYGEGESKFITKLSAAGTAEGTVVGPKEKGVLKVQTEGVPGPMRFVSRWIRQDGKWIPSPKEVELIDSVEPGQKVKVSYILEEHFRINGLKILPEEKKEDKADPAKP